MTYAENPKEQIAACAVVFSIFALGFTIFGVPIHYIAKAGLISPFNYGLIMLEGTAVAFMIFFVLFGPEDERGPSPVGLLFSIGPPVIINAVAARCWENELKYYSPDGVDQSTAVIWEFMTASTCILVVIWCLLALLLLSQRQHTEP